MSTNLGNPPTNNTMSWTTKLKNPDEEGSLTETGGGQSENEFIR